MIRSTTPEEIPELVEIAAGTGVFKPMELVALEEVLADYFSTNQALGHRAATIERDRRAAGFVYFAPAAMTDRTWYLYWIAVAKYSHARGLGAALLHHAEAEIRQSRGRLLLIETSSLPHYEPTRKFYAKHAYEEHSIIRDYYADGDHLVIFRKRFEARLADI
jgi:ribosomal protein S18 acetylase RimI-like enzyme